MLLGFLGTVQWGISEMIVVGYFGLHLLFRSSANDVAADPEEPEEPSVVSEIQSVEVST